GAGRELRAAVRLDPELHEVRIYLAHLLFERGEMEPALREMERVPPSEHWDPLSLWRFIELKCTLEGCDEKDDELAPWRERWEELQAEPDAVDDLLAEVEAAFEEEDVQEVHRVRTTDGRLYTGSWDEILLSMRDELADPSESLRVFMHRAAQRVRRLTGCELPCDDAEAFLRESARIGLVRIEG
ncbi:MAG TPA: hypothetical protein VFI96_04905, partial [Longimicrobiaceae bacterium]|nr:hypothetical protein [Longimicrobiaceae bacterium]